MIKGIDVRFATSISKKLNGSVGASTSSYTFVSQFYNYNSYQWEFNVACSGRPYEALREVIEFLRTRNGFIRPFIFIDETIQQENFAPFDSVRENVWRFRDRRHIVISEGDAIRIGFNQNSIPEYTYFSIEGQFYQLDQGGFVFEGGTGWVAPISSFYRKNPDDANNPAVIWSRPEVQVRLVDPFTTTTSEQNDLTTFSFTALEDVSQ